MQSEHVSDPAEPGLLSAERGGITLFQKGGPNMACQSRRRRNAHGSLNGGFRSCRNCLGDCP